MKKLLVSIICLFSTHLLINAKILKVNDAINYATITSKNQFQQSSMMSPMAINAKKQVTYELKHTIKNNGRPTVYIANKSNGGFIIISANDDVANGLLGYVDYGSFDVDSIPDNLQYFLEAAAEAIYYADVLEDKQDKSYEYQKKPAIAPIMATKWGYWSPYNRYTPIVGEKKTPPGCVAIAMAQIMNVYRYPDCGVGQVSYTLPATKEKLSYNFEDNPIDWANINSKLANPATDAGWDAVARLLYTCGMSVKMSYNTSGSSSSLSSALSAFVNTFDYSYESRSVYRSWYTNEEWEDLVYNELYEGRPVFYAGYSQESGGHAFVCDGYNNGYFHINWGWGGSYDGYFLLSTLDAKNNSMGFARNEQIIIGIQPKLENPNKTPIVYFNGDFVIENTSVSRKSSSYSTVKSYPSGIFYGSVYKNDGGIFGLKMINTDNGDVQYVESSKHVNSMIKGSAITSYNITIRNLPSEEGTYITVPAFFQDCDSTWYDINVQKTKEWAYVTQITSDSIFMYTQSDAIANDIIDAAQVIDMTLPPTTSYITPMDVELTVKNKTQYLTNKVYTPVLLKEDEIISRGTAQFFDLEPGESEKVVWKSYWDNELLPGDYQVALMDKKGKLSQNRVDIQVQDMGNMTTAAARIILYDISTTHFVEVYNIDGMLVAKGEKIKRTLKPGIYIIQYQLSNGTKEIRKILIN